MVADAFTAYLVLRILAGISKAAQWIERFCASNLNQCRGTEGGCWVLWDTLLIRVECMVGGATH